MCLPGFRSRTSLKLHIKNKICGFRLVQERKPGKHITLRHQDQTFQKRFQQISENSFALSGAEDNTTGPLDGGAIASLPLLRTLVAKLQEPNVVTKKGYKGDKDYEGYENYVMKVMKVTQVMKIMKVMKVLKVYEGYGDYKCYEGYEGSESYEG